MNRQDGFTLVELLVALTIGISTMAAAMSVLVGANRRSDDALRRADATQRARVTMDAITQDLRSQTCLRSTTPPAAPMIAGTGTSVTFYMDFTDNSSTGPGTQRRTIALDGSGNVTERRWANPAGTGASFVRTLGTSIAAGDGTTLFKYYAFNKTTGAADQLLTPDPSAGLSATDLPTVARIVVSLKGLPRGTVSGAKNVTPLVGDAFIRLVDPDGSPVPLCA